MLCFQVISGLLWHTQVVISKFVGCLLFYYTYYTYLIFVMISSDWFANTQEHNGQDLWHEPIITSHIQSYCDRGIASSHVKGRKCPRCKQGLKRLTISSTSKIVAQFTLCPRSRLRSVRVTLSMSNSSKPKSHQISLMSAPVCPTRAIRTRGAWRQGNGDLHG